MLSKFFLTALVAVSSVQGFISNIPNINKLAAGGTNSKFGGGSIKSPSDLLYSGSQVCDKFSSTIQSQNGTTDFPISFNLYVANDADAPNDNYTVDLYFKNPNHRSLNDFAILNASDSQSVLSRYNPILISKQPGFGVEFKFKFAKGLLCQFLYQFTVMYQLEKQDDHSKTSDKIFLVGSCQENRQYHPDAYYDLINQGYRCVEYNSGYKYDGGKDWCAEFYPSNQCCNTYQRDELVSRQSCPAPSSSSAFSSSEAPSTSFGKPTSFVASTLSTVSVTSVTSTAPSFTPTIAAARPNPLVALF